MWLHIPSSVCPSSPVSEEWNSDLKWRASLLGQFATLRGRVTAPKSWLRVWKRESWMMRLFGRILEPLTAQHGVDAWILSLPDSHANPTPKPVKAKEKRDGSFLKLCESRKNVKPHLSFLRMLPDLGTPASQQSTKSYPPQGMMRNGIYLPLAKRARPTKERESLSWPTPTVESLYANKAGGTGGDGLATAIGGRPNPEWVAWLMGFPPQWINYEPSEMQLSRNKSRSRGSI